MNNERSQLWIILEAMLICVVFASMYAIGGSGDFFGGQKWIRRFLAPSMFSAWAFLRGGGDWRYLVQMPLMMGALCLPYGADNLWGKIFLRGIFGAANGAASSVVNAWSKNWTLAIMHLVIVVTVRIGAGVWNQFPNAMAEQFVIGLVIILIPALSVRPKQ